MKRYLVARLDSAGDVILAGPAVRAAAAAGDVTLLCGPDGEAAGRLLPGVSEVMVWDAPWTGFDPPPVDAASIRAVVEALSAHRFDAAAVLTSFHQSPLPLAMLLRMAGVARIAAVSVDYPGSLLDHRVPYEESLHEVEQALRVTAALGLADPAEDRLVLHLPAPTDRTADGYVVIHPGASVPARAISPPLAAEVVRRLADMGRRVVITGTESERSRWPLASRPCVEDRRGTTSFSELAAVIAGAEAIVVGNTGPAHIAAAVGTPVVSIFAPVVPFHRWRPWKVPTIMLGDQTIACAGCRSRVCPLPAQECVAGVTPGHVMDALARLRQPLPAGSHP